MYTRALFELVEATAVIVFLLDWNAGISGIPRTVVQSPHAYFAAQPQPPLSRFGPFRHLSTVCRLQVLAFKTEEVTGGALVPLAPSGVRYRFVVPQYVTTFGQSLRVVGSLPELGFWNPTLAPVMVWGEGHSWTLEAQLPQRSFEFKVRGHHDPVCQQCLVMERGQLVHLLTG